MVWPIERNRNFKREERGRPVEKGPNAKKELGKGF